MDSIVKNCGVNIRKHRETQGLLQRELADRAKLPTRTVGRIERGEVDVRISTLKKIADALGISIRELL